MSNVDHPRHYTDGCSIECIDVMELAFGQFMTYDFCVGSAFKYIWRCENKGGAEDLDKARWFVNYIRTKGWVEYYSDNERIDKLDEIINKLEEKLEIKHETE